MRPLRPFALAAFAVFVSLTSPARPARAEPSDDEVSARLAFIETRLDAGTPAANRWSFGWLATYGTLTLAQVGVALGTTDPGLRRDTGVGAVSASLGVVPFGVLAFTPRFAAEDLAVLPSGTPAERRIKLARAEGLLQRCAEVEKRGRSWLPHVVGSAVSLAWGFALALGYHRVRTGIINTAVGIGIVELQIWTQPTRAIDDWKAYGRFHAGKPERPPPARTLSIAPGDGGISLLGRF